MFEIKRTFGQHSVLSLDVTKHKFREFFETLFKTSNLEHIHEGSPEFASTNLQDIETSLHKHFYSEIKSKPHFKELYCTLIQDIYLNMFPDEQYIIYQSFPSVRFQFPNNVCVPPHYDADEIGCHPLGEHNFLLPITIMTGSRRLFIESEPKNGDFEGIDLNTNELLFFNGNTCTHYNQVNVDNVTRISLDFRTISRANYITYINSGNISLTNPRDPTRIRKPVKMIIGGYYQLAQANSTIDTMTQWHIQNEMLLQSRPNFDIAEATACFNYMKDGNNFVTEFKQTTALEKIIAEYTGARHCIMTTSGNMAIILALMALDIKEGDEVIVPNYTMIASINSIRMVGAKPVLIDVDPTELTINLSQIISSITMRTKAVLHVSLNNRHTGLPEIADYCEKHKILLIEDAAQSLGCCYKGKHFGTFGIIGCFSLSTPKIISTGQGGFLLTNNDECANKLLMIKNFGRTCSGVDVFETFGINAKFTDIQAVIGIEQMKKLPERINRIKEIWNIYYKYLGKWMILPSFDGWLPWFVDMFTTERNDLMEFLKVHNIQTRATYPEISKTPIYSNNKNFPVSKQVSEQGIFLPTHTCLLDKEIHHICSLIQMFIKI